MKVFVIKLMTLFVIFCEATFLMAEEKPLPPRLIVRGDDMGFSHSGNQGIMKCALEGIQTSIEVIVPSPWFPEAVKLLKEHPKLDVGIHIALSSEWDNLKWRPITNAPSLRDPDGYFYPMIFPNKNYPKRSLKENDWKLEDIEKEVRAQIELGKKHLPQISHISAHMGCDRLSNEVTQLFKKLAKEYQLDIHPDELGVKYVGYAGKHGTFAEKQESFLKMLDTLEAGKTYLFVEHPAIDSPELRAIHHVGYENVAADRQGVTDLWTDPRIKKAIQTKGIQLISYRDLKPLSKSAQPRSTNEKESCSTGEQRYDSTALLEFCAKESKEEVSVKSLPRSSPESQGVSSKAMREFIEALDSEINTMHSLMVVRHGKVITECWWKPEKPEDRHVMYSLSKSFTSTAIGLLIEEEKISLDDEVIKFFPDSLPKEPSNHLKSMRIRDLLSMNTGHETEPKFTDDQSWVRTFLAHPVPHKPGTHFKYNSPATYMCSAIVTKVTGKTVLEYLKPRLFDPLGIENPEWGTSPEGYSLGGWGLKIRTEDIAKFGQLYLQKGKWNGKQLIPEKWVEQATSRQVSNGSNPKSDWEQGYGYQFWRCRNGAYRGDGAFGQFCIVMPDQDTVVAITANSNNMQAQLNVVWNKLLPFLKSEKALPENVEELEKLKKYTESLTVKPKK
ncbi:MAG: serine hydrolase [Gemmataceae bacterium]|nr:serine hydrolase [Gemmataceae bacterium]